MSVRTDLRDTAAAAALQMCKVYGAQGTYTSLTGESTATDVWLMPEGESTEEGEVIGVMVESSRRQFMVPRQSSPTWPPTNGVRTKAKLVVEDVSWYVESIESDDLGATWTLDCIRDHAAIAGVP